MGGPSWPDIDREDRRLAIHEAGHAIAGHLLGKKISYVTILSDTTGGESTSQTYGKVSCLPSPGKDQSTADVKNTIVFMVASRAAEELFADDVYSGIHTDMSLAYSFAKKLVVTLTSENRVKARKIELGECSDKKKEEFDDLVDQIIAEQYERAKTLLLENKDKHQLLVEALVKYKRLSRSEFLTLMETGKIESIDDLKKQNR